MIVRLHNPVSPDGSHYWSLTMGQDYVVLGIEADWYRLLDDTGEPILFDPACFEVIDATEPVVWVSTIKDGVRYAYPPEWNCPGFFEDWHDGDSEVRQQFSKYLSILEIRSIKS